ncbi:MAG: bacteriohemerythrin [Desulfobulbaceae bacterium]|nr:bacteriohemerythrin [Desulfobulbaceae bacterium]
MSILAWDKNIILDHPIIDQQHQKLVILVNEFYEAIRKKEANSAIMELLQGLIDYTEFHFKDEQNLMRLNQYPDYLPHVSEHRKFVAHVADCYTRISEGKLVISLEITSFLRSWLVEHIKVTDKKLCTFLAQKSGKQ